MVFTIAQKLIFCKKICHQDFSQKSPDLVTLSGSLTVGVDVHDDDWRDRVGQLSSDHPHAETFEKVVETFGGDEAVSADDGIRA